MLNQRDQHLLEALEELEQVFGPAKREREPVSLVLLDVDDLGLYTEVNGRKGRRRALSEVGRIAARAVREDDLVTRIGGEDVAIVLPGASKVDASRVAERIRRLIEKHPFSGEVQLPSGRLTASFGVATYPSDAGTASELAGSADRALYIAKLKGKNGVRVYEDNKRLRRRKEVALVGDFGTMEQQHEPLKTINISTMGLNFAAERQLPVGVLIDVRLRIPEINHEIGMAVRVLRCGEIRTPSSGWFSGRFQTFGGSYQIAGRILEISSSDLAALSQYLWGTSDGA